MVVVGDVCSVQAQALERAGTSENIEMCASYALFILV